jgi:hypothetical protein
VPDDFALISAYHSGSEQALPKNTDAKKPIRQDGLLHLFDAWQFMAGVLPATLRAVASQRSNPLPADLSYSGEHSPTDNR